MEKLTIVRGEVLPDGTVQPLPGREADICDMERGLCLQHYEDRVLANDIAYGLTHHSGYRLTGPWFRYEDARALQQALLALPIDWEASPDVLNEPHPAIAQAKTLILVWRKAHAVFVEEGR